MLPSRRSHRSATAVRLGLLLPALFAMVAARPSVADAQIPVDSNRLHVVYDMSTPVGVIYVDRERGSSRYIEHWIMFPEFRVLSQIVPASVNPYKSVGAFLARAPFPPGSRYARLEIAETATIRGR